MSVNRGFLVVAQNSDVDYVRQAYALALSIKSTQPTINNISIVTNDLVPEEYQSVFDRIIPIPFGDHAADKKWKVENRWKLYHASPYDETIVLDTDMLVLNNIENAWKFVESHNLFFTSVVKNYKGNTVVDTVYRKTFIENNLPNLYSGMFYFKKSADTEQFFKILEFITFNWQRIYFDNIPKYTQKFFSFDVSVSIAAKILGIDDNIVHTHSPFYFTHMKPALQGWEPSPGSWLTQTLVHFNENKELFLNNIKQTGIFHYVEDEFLTNDIIEKLNV
jgi:hypothetical protein